MARHCETCGEPLNYDEIKAGDQMCQWCFETYEEINPDESKSRYNEPLDGKNKQGVDCNE